MFAELRFYAIIAFLAMSFGLKAQCPPSVDVIFTQLILQYSAGETPTNLDAVDTQFPSAVFSNVDVDPVLQTWQTTEENFSGITLTGDVTIHYTDAPSEACEYVDGSLVGLVPVELSSFYGDLKNENIQLAWTTESEKENAGFEIEQSFDGERFLVIGMVSGVGNSEETQEYAFLDQGVRNRALSNTAYYRLAQIDYDGTKTYSEVVAIDLGFDFEEFEITKITGWDSEERKLQVHFYNPETIRKVNFLVTDINGRVIEKRSIFPESGLNIFEVDLSNDESPFYFLSLNNGKEVVGKKVALGLNY